jgi:hypothetical protein
MADFVLLLLTTIALLAVVGSVSRPGGYLTFPFTLGALMLGWVIPQLWALGEDPTLPQGAYVALVFMACCCLLAGIAGWFLPSRSRTFRMGRTTRPASVKGLTIAVACLTVFVALMTVAIELQPAEAREASQWSGPITIFAFFAQLRIVSLTLSLLMILRQRTPATIALTVVNLAITLPVAFVMLRRSEMVDVALAVVGALWFARRISIPRPAIAAGVAGIAVVVFSMAELRRTAEEIYLRTGERPSLFSPGLLQSVDFVSATTGSIGYSPDLRNAAYVIEYTDYADTFTLGAQTWNNFVHQWVPGQIVGYDVKENLMIGRRGDALLEFSHLYGFEYATGTTSTGFGSAYRDFGYFGSLYFLLIGVTLRAWFRRAEAGDIWHQALFLSGTTLALVSITHGHAKLFVSIPLFLGVVFAMRALAGRIPHAGSLPAGLVRRRAAQGRGLMSTGSRW